MSNAWVTHSYWNFKNFEIWMAFQKYLEVMSFTHTLDIQLIKLALLSLSFTMLKSHVQYYLQATACMTKQYQYLKHTDKFDLKFSFEQWVGGAVRLSYIYRTKQKTCTTGGQMILLDENATKVSYTSKHNVVCSYTLSILICYFNETNYLRNPHFLEKKNNQLH